MNNLIKKIPPLTEEQIEELKALEGREIDLSDIPEITREEWKKNFKPTRLRKKNVKVAS
jgi:uncharacterized protein YneF (UPF0154 family)